MSQYNSDALVPYGWSDRVMALYTSAADEVDRRSTAPTTIELIPARVTRVERSACIAVGPDGVERSLRAASLPAVGDWVVAGDGEVREILPRWSALARADPDGNGVQTLAADLDLVLVTAPADRASAARVERELALAWDSGALPLVVVTKCDLDAAGVVGELTARLQGVDVLAVSAATGAGVEDLRARLAPNHTAVLLGPSGAGKSTLANALLGSDTLATGAVREGDARGRHTTTSRQLVAVPGGGVLIDTPGLRSLGLHGDLDISAGFPEVSELAERCRFADCRHEDEPGCAVTEALAAGELDPDRLESFHKLAREAAWEQRRHDPLKRRESLRQWKAITKASRAHDKRRGR